MWDDQTEHWGHDSPLKIHGKHIALVYWPELYKYWKQGQWQGTKSKWFEFKVVVKRWREAGSPEAFWADFKQANGQPMKYTAITKRLRQERMAVDREVADQAREEYGDRFGETFKYRQGADWYVMKDPAKIASRYRDLRALASNSVTV
ncbi:hypothetical protein BJ138DRAFT_1120269 [Hygrophoropsis aurantiaca]|uniref:Uncharacterized protein n=1 Tax=Hygrophoropsis aurantiaca TaxID=72124 RepID=A0ACB7ZQV6_9AGAM|nr:hypothetical protein BJ138DRAFT_1120269 [Hygrophoropsis aurantiaca]